MNYNEERKDYALYLRKSRTKTGFDEEESLENHETRLRKIASEKGYHIAEIYREGIMSGETIAARPEMQRLLDDVWAGKYAGVLVHEVERLARGNTKDQGEVEEAFMETNTKIITPYKTYDPRNESDESFFTFGMFMSRNEYKTIRRRMKEGTQAALEKGQFLGSRPPYGWQKVTINKMKTLEPSETNPIMHQIYDYYIDERMTTLAIAKKLTRMGIPSPTGGEWETSVVRDILANPVNAGKIRWGYRRVVKKRVDGKTKKVQIRNNDYEIYEGLHDGNGTISWERYLEAQKLLPHSTPLKGKTKLINPLAGILHCAKCGKTMRFHTGRGKGNEIAYRYAHPDKVLCTTKSMPIEKVFEVFVEGMKQHIADFEVKAKNDDGTQVIKEYEKELSSMIAKLDKLNTKRKHLFDYFEREIYTEAEFLERKTIVTNEISEQEKQIAIIKKNVPQKIDYNEKISTFYRIISLLEEAPKENAVELNHLIKSVCRDITYDCVDLGRCRGGIINLNIFLK